jgi:hypothetical protein
MFKRRFRLPSPALVISTVTLSLVLGGTAVAATTAKHKDVKADKTLIKAMAPSLSVKHAKTADSATNATNATNAAHATSADSATNATNAAHATSADSATNATNAAHATSADSATTAGSAPPSGAAGGALSGSYPDPSLQAPEDWHEIDAAGEPAFQNGWVNESPLNEVTAGFYADPYGQVHLKGMITSGSNAPIFSLPVGYRPGLSLCELVFRAGSGTGQLCIFASGDVAVLSGTGTVALDGVTFRIGE